MGWFVIERFEIVDSRYGKVISIVDDDMQKLRDEIKRLKNENHEVQYYYIVDKNCTIKIIPIMLMYRDL